MPIVSYFKTIFDERDGRYVPTADKPQYLALDYVLNSIGNSDTLKQQTEDVTSGAMPKDSLNCICFAGKFSYRSDSSLIEHSGYVPLDFDKVGDSMEDVMEDLKSRSYIKAFWKSQSQDGIHAIAKIAFTDRHRDHYRSLLMDIGGLDNKCINESRFFYLCYDKDIYINESPDEYTGLMSEEEWKKANEKDSPSLSDIGREISPSIRFVAVPIQMIKNAPNGQRHEITLKAAKLMGGYVGSNYISRSDAREMLIDAARINSPDELSDRIKAIDAGLDYGISSPIDIDVKRELKRIEHQAKAVLGKVFFTLKDVESDLDTLFKNGVKRGADVGYSCLRENISIAKGTTTYLYAAPFSGKTELWLDILVNLSEFYGWKHALLTPETGGAEEVYAELISKVAMADFYGDYNNKMTEEAYAKAKLFVDRHFIVIDPSDAEFTYKDFIDTIIVIESKYKIKIDTALIDPWNELAANLAGESRDLWLERALGDIRKSAKANDWHICIATHLRDQEFRVFDSVRYYPMGTPREIAQGQPWYRKGLQMISAWRPLDTNMNPLPKKIMGMHGYDEEELFEVNEMVIGIQKSKPKGVGATGIKSLFYDAKKHRFYEMINGVKSYAKKWDGESVNTEVIYKDFYSRNDNEDEAPF